jgi:hypothetical protein
MAVKQPEPGRWRMAFGVPSLLAYLAGSFVLIVTILKTAGAESLDDIWEGAWTALRVAFLLIALGVALQAVRERGGPDSDLADAARAPFELRAFKWPAILILGPVLWGWLQFELYWDPISLLPLVSIIGGVALGVVAGRLFGRTAFGTSATMSLVAILGLPVAALSIALPSQHFRRHGSTIEFVVYSDHHPPTRHEMAPEMPEPPRAPERSLLGPGTAELMNAFANAKPVEGYEIDGVLMVKGDDGRLRAVERGNLDEMFEDARRADDAAHAKRLKAYEVELEAWKAEVDALHRGGRLFNRSGP